MTGGANLAILAPYLLSLHRKSFTFRCFQIKTSPKSLFYLACTTVGERQLETPLLRVPGCTQGPMHPHLRVWEEEQAVLAFLSPLREKFSTECGYWEKNVCRSLDSKPHFEFVVFYIAF